MLFSIVASLAFAGLALGGQPADATNYSDDNLLQAFQYMPASPCPSPSAYSFNGTSGSSSVNLVLTINRSVSCRSTGFQITGICGNVNGQPITFYSTTDSSYDADQCFFPNHASEVITRDGVVFQAGGHEYNIWYEDGVRIDYTLPGASYSSSFVPVCTTPSCPN